MNFETTKQVILFKFSNDDNNVDKSFQPQHKHMPHLSTFSNHILKTSKSLKIHKKLSIHQSITDSETGLV